MKKQLKSLLLIVCLISMALPSWGQASTEGTDFWVALTLASNPEGGAFKPYIAISTQDYQGGHVTVTCPSNSGWSGIIDRDLTEAWTIISSTDMSSSNWYNTNITAEVDGNPKNRGIHVHADRKVSVFCAWQGDKSFDAANILPAAVLKSNYIIQDYPPYDNNGNTSYSTFVIVATEDNTIVDITPSETTYDGKPANVTYQTPLLMKGQVFHVLSSKEHSLSGTRVEARDNKPIAVFNGDVMTRVPDPNMGNRDLLYEQAMPTDYWGREFVVTRSLRSDANRVRITALEDGTAIYLNGLHVTDIDATKTYEFELAKTGFVPKSACAKPAPDIIYEDVVFIETSCPCATYLYDVGKDYRMNSGSENENGYGDPSMVWMSPLEQRIDSITFGLCGTNVTKDHFINIIKRTKDSSIKLVDSNGDVQIDNTAAFIPVPGNSQYSYYRKQLIDNIANVKDSYTLTSDSGVIAHVYGNGVSESYAYSVGSATVGREIKINEVSFVDQEGAIDYTNAPKFCLGEELTFAPQDLSGSIYRVIWNFGDGTSKDTTQAKVKHTYYATGWYDASAIVFGEEFCSHPAFTDTINFTFKVVKQDTVYKPIEHHCITKDSTLDGRPLSADSVAYYLTYGSTDTTHVKCPDTVYITPITYGIETVEYKDTIEGKDIAIGYNGIPYTSSQDVMDTIEPFTNLECRHYISYYVKVIACLKMNIVNDLSAQHVCPGENLTLTYSKTAGNIDGDAQFKVPGQIDTTLTISDDDTPNGRLTLPIAGIKAPGYYSGQIIVNDLYCGGQKIFPVNFAVNYPDSIFKFKFNNVLAVYKPGQGYNTGYDFEHYEWHIVRDGNDQIVGGDVSVLYLGQNITFENGDSVYVVLTDVRGVTLPSCPQWLREIPDYNLEEEGPSQAPARKMLINGQFIIRRDDADYDIYGQRVK